MSCRLVLQAMCDATGSNPAPMMNLMLNQDVYHEAEQAKSENKADRPSFSRHIMRKWTLGPSDVEQVFSCNGDIPGDFYEDKVASLKIKVRLGRSTLRFDIN